MLDPEIGTSKGTFGRLAAQLKTDAAMCAAQAHTAHRLHRAHRLHTHEKG
jgi:hypothetical protein